MRCRQAGGRLAEASTPSELAALGRLLRSQAIDRVLDGELWLGGYYAAREDVFLSAATGKDFFKADAGS